MSVIQGITEIMPISSSGHLALAAALTPTNFYNALAIITILHSGSVIAILYWYQHEITSLLKNFFASLRLLNPFRRGSSPAPFEWSADLFHPYLIALGLLPSAIIAYLLRGIAEHIVTDYRYYSLLFILNGLVILVTAFRTRGERTLSELEWQDFIFIGIAQGFAVLPGISRLGITLCAGLWKRLNWYEAVRLAFLYAIPIIFGGIFIEFSDAFTRLSALSPLLLITFLFGLVIVFFLSVASLSLLTRTIGLERRMLFFFGEYCLLLGIFSGVYFQIAEKYFL
jgi:undecaprenyl-diphosphatase